ncbi:VC0807 family protein [Uliginosibacterium sp. 31-16]|uniref:VC0807 family protein n=1 Tax=Uliginosibacterium sp. 31-16 TaxID=3068315 RepID=UPI00273D250D|nr:VC0807 family protein [Uliginosibacterium sp. 31-16]MDP5239535.1 VC0807 family protein [Uliginosibacterium sp. 31-16]
MKKQHLRIAAELAVNLCLPWLSYTLAEPHYGEFGALLISSIPPLLWSLGELAWHRRIDALSMLVLAGIVLSALAMALGGDARLLLVRESLISGLIGLVFLISLLFKRPLVYFLARATVTRQNAENGATGFHTWWQNPPAQRAIRGITGVWGLGLTFEATLRIWLAFHWPTERVLAIAPALGYLITGGLGLWTFWRVRSLKNRRTDASPPSVNSE